MSKSIRLRPASGILPPYLLFELGSRTGRAHYFETLVANANLHRRAVSRDQENPMHHYVGAGRSVIEVYDCQNTEELPGKRSRFEGEPPTGSADVDNAYNFTLAVRKFYLDIHGRNGINAHGMKMISSVNYGLGFNNAYWDGKQMTYGNGDQEIFATFVLLDVCGHEITHGVSEFESQLAYWKQAGALNESHSDVFGKMIEVYAKNQTADEIDWVLGRGIFMPGVKGEGIRNMLHPGTAYDDPRLGKDPQPADMSAYYNTKSDNGGVHYNSGIINRAFALFVSSLSGYEWKKAARIWFAARAAAGANPTFASHAFSTLEAARTLGTASDVRKLANAWDAVGVKPSKKISRGDSCCSYACRQANC
jgi:Zn-dependent metalloprotease